MHDYHAVEALVERLTGGPDGLGSECVTEVRVRAGVAFSPEALQQAFELLSRDTPLEGASLVIEAQSVEHECPACRSTWSPTEDDVAGLLLICPSCGAPSELGGPAGLEVLNVRTETRVP